MEDTRGMFKPNFNLLWLLDVNKLSRQLVATAIFEFFFNMATYAVILNLFCYYYRFDVNKAPFWIYGNMADTRGKFKPNLLFWTLRYRHFEF